MPLTCLTRRGWVWDAVNSELEVEVNGTKVLGSTTAALTITPATTVTGALTCSATASVGTGLTVVAGGATITAGGLSSASPTVSIGYSTGAGGAVTQATSKATGVTLSKVCGTITTHNAELAAAAEVTFIVTNTTVAITDTVVASVQSGGTPGEYMVGVSTVAAGSFHLTLANLSGAAASDAVLINFAVIKAVAA